MQTFRTGWYLMYTKPRHEKKVHSQLAEIHVDSYLPTRKVFRTWHDRKKCVDEPLFPSYVFIYLNDMENFYDGLATDGALYYVKTGKEIARVSEVVVNSIKLAAGNGSELEVSQSYFQPGRQLVIHQGALAGLTCELVQLNNRQRLLVRVDLLQRNLLVTLPAEYVMAL